MKSETLIAHVPTQIATLAKAKARQCRLSTSRYLTKLIESDVAGNIRYTMQDLQRIIVETDAECKVGKRKIYTRTDEFIRDLDEYARKQKV
jgi:hypothetical protein